MKQTFIIQHWCGANTYLEAARKSINGDSNAKHDFDRVGVKRVKTALKHLAEWKHHAIEKHLEFLYPTLTREDARYEILSTPDGFNPREIVASGLMRDL